MAAVLFCSRDLGIRSSPDRAPAWPSAAWPRPYKPEESSGAWALHTRFFRQTFGPPRSQPPANQPAPLRGQQAMESLFQHAAPNHGTQNLDPPVPLRGHQAARRGFQHAAPGNPKFNICKTLYNSLFRQTWLQDAPTWLRDNSKKSRRNLKTALRASARGHSKERRIDFQKFV